MNKYCELKYKNTVAIDINIPNFYECIFDVNKI